MPNLRNARKALRQAKKSAVRNLVVKKSYKDAIKLAKKAIVTKETDLTEKLRLAQKKLGKAVKSGVLKKNAAGRKLSRLMKKANADKK